MPQPFRNVDDEIFEELVAVLSFSEEASATMGGAPIPEHLCEFANGEAQARGFDTWRHANELELPGADLIAEHTGHPPT